MGASLLALAKSIYYDVLYLNKLSRSRCILYVFECPNGFCGFKMNSGFWLPCNNKHARKVSGLGDVHKATNSLFSFFGILLLTVMFRHNCSFIWYRQVCPSLSQKSVSFQPLTFILLFQNSFFLLQSVSSLRFPYNIIFKLI